MFDHTKVRPNQPPPWRDRCANKKEKKRVLDGRTAAGGRARAKKVPSGGNLIEKTPSLRSLINCMENLSDPRVNRRRLHLLIDIVVISVCAVIAHADTWADIFLWGDSNEAWLRQFLELPNGIPSRDTLRRTVSRLDPDQFRNCFLKWISSLRKNLGGVIAIDGKTLRGSRQANGKPLHIVSAWATENHLTLGQCAVDGKSNEITAIPELLELLHINGAIVTIDAMGCQKAIAEKIRDKGGHFCLAVKDNQATLADDIREAFATAAEADFKAASCQQYHTSDKGHGRIEERSYYTMPTPETLRTAHEWPGIESIGMAITYRSETSDGELRYYINSFAADVKTFANAVRQHWGIENSLHWVMDVTFREDDCRIGKDYGAENISWLRRLAISIVRNHTKTKGSIRSKRVRAGYNVRFLEEILDAIPDEN